MDTLFRLGTLQLQYFSASVLVEIYTSFQVFLEGDIVEKETMINEKGRINSRPFCRVVTSTNVSCFCSANIIVIIIIVRFVYFTNVVLITSCTFFRREDEGHNK